MRTFIKLLACLLVLAMLPMTAFASSQATFSIIPGDDLASIAGVGELLEATSVSFAFLEDTLGISLNMDDVSVASINTRFTEDGLYVQSEAISADPLYVGWEAGFAYLTDLAINSGVDEEEAAAMQLVFDQAMETATTQLATMDATQNSALTVETIEESKAMISELFADDPAMAEMMTQILDKFVITEGVFTSDQHDDATIEISFDMTKDDLITILTSDYMTQMIIQAEQLENPDESAEEIAAEVAEEMEELVAFAQNNLEFFYSIVAYATDDGETLVALKAGYHLNVADEDEEVSMDMAVEYYRLTDEDGVHHNADAMMSFADGEEVDESAEMKLTLTEGIDGAYVGEAGMYLSGVQLTASIAGTSTEEANVGEMYFYVREGATAYVALTASDRPLIGIGYAFNEADASLFEAIQSATPETAMQVLGMSDEDKEVFLTDVQNRLMSTLMTVLGAMPAEALALMQ